MDTANNPISPKMLPASVIIDNKVRNPQGEDLGVIEELMIDLEHGRIAYAVLSFGGFLGIGNKLFAIPWSVLDHDPMGSRFILDIEKEKLEQAPGFDKDSWPDVNDPKWREDIYHYYNANKYWMI